MCCPCCAACACATIVVLLMSLLQPAHCMAPLHMMSSMVMCDSASLMAIKCMQLHAARCASAHIMGKAVATWSLQQPCTAAPSLQRSQIVTRPAALHRAYDLCRKRYSVGNKLQQSKVSDHWHATSGVVAYLVKLGATAPASCSHAVMACNHARAHIPYTIWTCAHLRLHRCH